MPTSTRELRRVCMDQSITMMSLHIALENLPHGRVHGTRVPQKLSAQCERGLTPLHYLCANPKVTPEMIRATLKFHPEAALIQDKVLRIEFAGWS